MPDNKCCFHCGENISKEHIETMPNGKEERFCSAECARDRYREELNGHGD